ncbi:MAG TPA: EipA family protein [Rhizomicrobium sp.]|jgi:hypothetical protein|nr:EipA family protein [Rhizomicrobium sp.]
MSFARILTGAIAALAISTATLAQDNSAQPQDKDYTPRDYTPPAGAAPRDDAPPPPPPVERERDHDTFTDNEITNAASDFFGITTEAAAKAVQRVFRDQGQPDAYIKGDEGSGAVVVGLRYGEGWLVRKHFDPVKVYWKGPSVGFDIGGNASKFFALVYNLKEERRLYQRFPGAEGSYYFVAGLGVNYLRSGGVTIAPMRTGLGLRAGVNAHYLVFSERRDWFPF